MSDVRRWPWVACYGSSMTLRQVDLPQTPAPQDKPQQEVEMHAHQQAHVAGFEKWQAP